MGECELSAVTKTESEDAEEGDDERERRVSQDLTVDLVLGGCQASPIAARDQPASFSARARALRSAPLRDLRYTHSSSGSLAVFVIAV